jgi:hypothetical protein
MALSAAGIEADVQESRATLEPPIEAVLAWTVREGATNVIRHSGARHCTLKITTSLTDAGVEVIDDGRGAVTNGASAGLPNVGVGVRSGNGVADSGVARNTGTARGADEGTGGGNGHPVASTASPSGPGCSTAGSKRARLPTVATGSRSPSLSRARDAGRHRCDPCAPG